MLRVELLPILRAALPFYQAMAPHRIKPAKKASSSGGGAAKAAEPIVDDGISMSLCVAVRRCASLYVRSRLRCTHWPAQLARSRLRGTLRHHRP